MTATSRPEAPARGLLVASDLDGTLLDDRTYSHAAAAPALAELRVRHVPLVLASSKTRAEMEPLARELGLCSPLIVENGGALVVPARHLVRAPPGARREDGAFVLELGLPRALLVRHLAALRAETGASVRGFASLSRDEVVELTGLDTVAAGRALERSYDEPFLLDAEPRPGALAEAARRRGLYVTRGGRFLHLTGACDKGRALRVLLGLHAAEGRAFATVGLGDAPIDLSLLQAVERPIVVPRPDGRPAAELASALPGAECAPAPGPSGWNAAVLAVLGGQRLPRVAEVAGVGS